MSNPINPSIPPSSPIELDRAVDRLAHQKDRWLQVSIADRVQFLEQCLAAIEAVAEDWVRVSCEAKGLDPEAESAGEEWLVGPVGVAMLLRSWITTLKAGGQRSVPLVQRSWGQDLPTQTIAQVFPENWMERWLFLGMRGEVWLEPGQPPTQGLIYRQKPAIGKVALVLGAGNLSCIAPADAIHKLFAEDEVVLLKMNPVNQAVGPVLEQVFDPLITAGFLAIVYGGAEVGAYLCQHPQIESIHITGSDKTHDRIVWGKDPIAQKQTGMPLLNKPISSELGGVTPIIVVPGEWSASDLRFQARQVASTIVHNASFDCVAGQVLVLAQGWPQRQAFLESLHHTLAQAPPRLAYYPGAWERYQAFCDRYPQAIPLGSDAARPASNPTPYLDPIPWTVLPDVPAQPGEYALTQEAFCGILAEVSLNATTAEDFLPQAIDFANQTLWGNLGCVLLIDPKTQRQQAQALEQAIAQLCYGAIGVNAWIGAGFALPGLAWGAFPGNPLSNIQSGRGFVHNTYLWEHPQKSVLYAPFRPWFVPTWFFDHRTLKQTAQAYLQLLLKPTWTQFLKVAIAGLRG